MSKTKGVSRRGNTITVKCDSREQTNFILELIARRLSTHRFWSGAQWSKGAMAKILNTVSSHKPFAPNSIGVVVDNLIDRAKEVSCRSAKVRKTKEQA